MSVADRLDRFQRRRGWLAMPIAVVYKFTEDRGPYLAALVTYYAFLSLFPLMLVFSSALGFFLEHNPKLHDKLVGSALSDFPIIGAQLRTNVGTFHGSGVALAIGVAASLYGALGAMQAAQTAFNQIYAVPRNEHPNPIRSRLRSAALLLLFGTAVVVSTGIATVLGTTNMIIDQLGTTLRVVGFVAVFGIDLAVFAAAFQLLTARTLRFRQVVRGAVLAGASWEVLQTLGTGYASSRLQHASAVYGAFGLVLASIAWIYLQAVVIMLAAEINMVTGEQLWPRALLTPFTDQVDLTDADRRAYQLHAAAQRFKGFETVRTEFGTPPRRESTEHELRPPASHR